MRIKAVLFDLDGTLLDTLDDIADSANRALGIFGYPARPADAYRYFVGNGVDKLMLRIIPAEAQTPEKIAAVKKEYVEWYKDHSLDRTRPYGGVTEMLGSLKSLPLKLAVVSNKPDADSKFTVSRSFAADLFDVVSGGQSGVPLKPDPAIALTILESFGVSPREAVMVGDTSVDISTAKNAGCVSVGAAWGFRPEEAEDADFVISHPSELPGLIGGMS